MSAKDRYSMLRRQMRILMRIDECGFKTRAQIRELVFKKFHERIDNDEAITILSFLVDDGIIRFITNTETGERIYIITQKGQDFLAELKKDFENL